MRRVVLLLGVVVLALAAVVGGNAATGKSAYDLKGEVYASGFKIEMVNRANQHLKTVKAGTYRIKIEDKASMHNFHLTGPGVNKSSRWVASPRRRGPFASSRASTPTLAMLTQ